MRQKKRNKWKKPLIWVGSSMAGLLIIGYFGMNIAMSYVLQSLVPQVPLEISNDASSETSLVASNKGNADAKNQINPTSAPTESTKIVEAAQSSKPEEAVQPKGTTKDQQSVKASPPNTNEAKTAEPTLTPTPAATKNGFNYEAQVTTEKAKEVQDAITLKEKAAVSSVLLKKLSASDLQLFAKMAGSGLSVEEKKKAKEIILQKLTEDEYNQLIGIAAKYGLSQGKSYQQTQPKATK